MQIYFLSVVDSIVAVYEHLFISFLEEQSQDNCYIQDLLFGPRPLFPPLLFTIVLLAELIMN